MSNSKNKKEIEKECVEAVPGPAIVISKETYKKMQENNNAKQNQERIKKFERLFKKINKEEQVSSQDKELSL